MTVLVIHADKDHLNHCFHPHQRVSNRFYFMPLVICIATSPVSISVFFVWPRPYLFTILESGHILLNYLAAAWSAILKESLCSKQFGFHYFWSKFAVIITSHSTCSSSLTELVLNSPPSFLQCFDFFRSTNFTW